MSHVLEFRKVHPLGGGLGTGAAQGLACRMSVGKGRCAMQRAWAGFWSLVELLTG